MRLTGEAKEKFEKWYLKTIEIVEMESIDESFDINGFYDLPQSMQFGVLQDWADSMGYEINVLRIHENDYDWSVWVDEEAKIQTAKTRQEARNAAIDKLNEIVNEK